MDPKPQRKSTWRNKALVRIAHLRIDRQRCVGAQPRADCDTEDRLGFIGQRLDLAEATANAWPRPWAAWSGGAVEGVWRNIHAAEVALLHVLPTDEFAGRSSEIIAIVEVCLPPDDSRRVDLQRRYSCGGGQLGNEDRAVAARALEAAFAEYDDRRTRVRSFRNVLIVISVAMMAAVAALGWVGTRANTPISLCAEQFCPTGPRSDGSARGGDVILVEVLGAAAAMLVGATSLSRIRGTSTPYAVPVWSAILKVPAGALAAVLGILLIEAGFVPGTTLETTSQIVAWALILGASQQTFTTLIDRQAQAVLDHVPTVEHQVPRRS
jgi:hypothetical protein